jgi:uncharacterized protein (DUF58 family)
MTPGATEVDTSGLERFARLAAPLLQGTAARGLGPRAARNHAGPGLEFLDLRNYEPGNDIRHIDWRQTARRQQTMIRRYRDEAAADWFICTDRSASVRLGEGKWLMTVQLTSALAYALLFAGHRVALLLFSDRIDGFCTLGRGPRHFATVLNLVLRQDGDDEDLLARRQATFSGRRSNLGLCRDFLTRDCNVFVVSDFLEPDGMREDLRSIRATVSSVDAIQVLARDEAHVPTSGSTMLRDVESGRGRPVLISEHAQEKARQALQSHCETLRRDCSTLGIRFNSCAVGQRWENILLRHFTAQP